MSNIDSIMWILFGPSGYPTPLGSCREQNGETLVLCCEGNAGFYEIGVMATPLECGYSVLGWNHPGFYGSSGRPYPHQERCAVDAVMQFAVTKLGFTVDNIVVMGWSIGGYTATWLAVNYPDIKGLILDATFDSLVPLAVPRMPASMSGLVTSAVNKFINLNVLEQLGQYRGPVLLYRRDHDEMITTSEGELWSNRGNVLLLGLLSQRYPGLATPAALDRVTSILYTPGALASPVTKPITKSAQLDLLTEDERGELLCFLATQLMTSLNTTHCTPLPAASFRMPSDCASAEEFLVSE